jgi:inositol phosphorylceramide synthase catalytic subunit
MRRLWRHARSLWPGHSIHWPLFFSYWAVLLAALGMLRWDHVAIAVAVLLVAFFGPRSKRFITAFAGYLLVAWMHDAARFIRYVGLSETRVLLCTLRDAEASLFGIKAAGQTETLQDYFFAHHAIAADLFFSVPYALFIYIAAFYAIYLYVADPRACARYCWAFAALNFAAIVTYHALPAAPPWYFHKYGCTVDLSAHAFEGAALARVDALFGLSYFHGFYSRAASIFGALPSLHVAYPVLIAYEGWRRHGRLGRTLALFYVVWMCCAAVYLDHHWILDVLLGWAYAAVILLAIRQLLPLRATVPTGVEPSTPAAVVD